MWFQVAVSHVKQPIDEVQTPKLRVSFGFSRKFMKLLALS